MRFQSTKIIDLGSCAFRQWKADHSHCKLIHGYRLQAKFWFSCNSLDDKNWVVDFGGLKELKQILEKQFDHTLCVAADDPALPLFQNLHNQGAADLRVMRKGVGIERTAEWCFEIADMHIRNITNNRCWVDKVEVWEHDKNSAVVSYEGCSGKCSKHSNDTIHNAEQFELPFDKKNDKQQTTTENNLQPAAPTPAPVPAQVGNNVTTGWSNPFGGTSWGM